MGLRPPSSWRKSPVSSQMGSTFQLGRYWPSEILLRSSWKKGGSPFAVIDLVADTNVDSGTFKVDLDDNRIKVYMAPGDKDQIEALRQHGEQSWEMAVLFPSIYLHAISEALRNLTYYPENRWARTMLRALERHSIVVDEEELKANALTHAQTLMERPVGTLMKALSREEEG